jgi:hypothetical protein
VLIVVPFREQASDIIKQLHLVEQEICKVGTHYASQSGYPQLITIECIGGASMK